MEDSDEAPANRRSEFDTGRGMRHRKVARLQYRIGGYEAHKDIDVSRLRFLDPEFHYKLAQQQQEAMAVGGWDPDAIMVVQTIDSKKRVERSWVRNPQSPNEVWVIDGGADFSSVQLSDLPQEVVLDRIRLQY